MGTFRIGGRLVAVAVVVLTVAGLAAPVVMAAEGERVLDPVLSLIGGCKAETLDPVEDPGCPGGTHPSEVFAFPHGIATDSQGNIFVSSKGKKADGSEGRIDIFGPDGTFIFEIPPGEVEAPQSMAIDSKGTLYVQAETAGEILRFEPCPIYDPAAGEVEYCAPPTAMPLDGPECTICNKGGSFQFTQMAINPSNDHLFVNFGGVAAEYSSAEEGNEEIRSLSIGIPGNGFGGGLAFDSARHKLYIQEGEGQGEDAEILIGVYDVVEGLPPREEFERIATIRGTAVPENHFGSVLSLAVDEGTGHLYVYDTENIHLWELDQNGSYVATVNFTFQAKPGMEIAIDNGLLSPNGKLSEEEGDGRYLFVPSHPTGTGHSFAFFVSTTAAPEVQSIAAVNVSEDEAELQARIDPNNLSTTYTFQIKAEGAAGWTTVGEGNLPTGNLVAQASAPARGLAPGTKYSYRVLASNEKGSDEAEGSFATYPSLPVEPSPCSNALLRTGFSALLPDCRAYELVTPADTNARAPLGAEYEGGGSTSRQVSPAGDKVPFRVEGGSLPGFGGTGGLKGDPYLATRTPAGWSTALIGPSAAEAAAVAPGTTSPDQGYSFWEAAGEGSAVVGRVTSYVRYPDGHSELVGQGSLGTDPESSGKLISEGGGHIVFNTGLFSAPAQQLEPQAAPEGTEAVYDRTADGITHVISLKPGNIPFGKGEAASYQGASPDGIGVAFKVGDTLYLRYNNEATFEIGEGVALAGIAEGGGRLFYVEGGNLEAFDVASQSVIEFADTAAEVVPVMTSSDGSTAYFVSKTAIPGSGLDPAGAKPKSGGQNLYRSEEGLITFVGTVTERDVVGVGVGAAEKTDGLGLWVAAFDPLQVSGFFGIVPARTTPDGNTFLFKSRAPLTGYDPDGHAEIYRYDSVAHGLTCLSCNPTGAAAQSDSTLQSETREGSELYSAVAWPENLRADGRRAFFESSEALVARDVDGRQDVYEWEDEGVGSCGQSGGCLYLISSPQSQRNEYIWAVSRSGDDVFFLSSDLLVGADADDTPSIYDARVNGGFPEESPGVCEGEGCRPHLTPRPPVPSGDSPVRGPGDNVKPRRCGKGKHKVKRGGKVRCVRKKRQRKHGARHHRTTTSQKGGSR
jgi:hypothetical protein